ncbi:uncharacterized protein LOC128953785 [Oppia nitens]|uniref:uncharacterized protein LOC128953785 n=1 Tax=Oppia nitens TaxID=1686743 RepID=UPI0023DC6E9C|nr:uncharacterized protein LOC128953785 [Oppia nitens]
MCHNFEVKIIFITLVIISGTVCREPTNNEELEDSENWSELSTEICKKDHSIEVKAKIEKCDELDVYYKFDSLTKQCDKLRSHPGTGYYEVEKGECKYQECYNKISKTKEFQELSKQLDTTSEETKVKKSYEKYICIRKALGLKV